MKKMLFLIILSCPSLQTHPSSNIGTFITKLCEQQVILHPHVYRQFCEPYIAKLLKQLRAVQAFDEKILENHHLANKYYDLLVIFNRLEFNKHAYPAIKPNAGREKLARELKTVLTEVKSTIDASLDIDKELKTTLRLCKNANKKFALMAKNIAAFIKL